MECRGRKVRLTLSDDGGVFEGFIHSMDRQAGKLSLEKVFNCDSGKKILGLQHFFDTEIEDIDVLEEYSVSKDDDEKILTRRGTQGVMKNKYSPAHLSRLKHLDPSKLTLKNQGTIEDKTVADDKVADNEVRNNTVADDKVADNEVRSNDTYTILAHLDNVFTEAIQFIRKHQVIGVALEGVSLGRSGKLCWIQIGTPTHVFLFDVLTLGMECFDEGLKSILEDENTLKVFHDCRMASDILHHQYKISIVNVFDTQVADVFVYRLRHHNDWPRFVTALAPCLSQHLDLSPEQVHWAVIREHCSQEDEEVWVERPLKKHVVEAAVKDVIYLLELRQVLMEKMLEEFVAGVNIYLSHVRDASVSDSNKYQTMKHLLPVAFQDVRRFMDSYRCRNPRGDVFDMSKDEHGFRENCSGIYQPNVNFSHDSLWHAGTAITKESTKVDENMSRSVIPEASVYTGTASYKSFEPKPVSQDSEVEPQGNRQLERKSPGTSFNVKTPESSDVDINELSGSKLMRALVYNQEGNSHESDSELDNFALKPAGTMVNQVRRKKNSPQKPAIPDTQKDRQTYEVRKQVSTNSLGTPEHVNDIRSDTKTLHVKNSERFLRDYKQFIKKGNTADSESSDSDVIPGLNIKHSLVSRPQVAESRENKPSHSVQYNFVSRGLLSQQEIDLCNNKRRSIGSSKSEAGSAKGDIADDNESDKTLSPEKDVRNDRINAKNGISLKSLLANQKQFSMNGFGHVSQASSSAVDEAAPVSERMQSLLDAIKRQQSP